MALSSIYKISLLLQRLYTVFLKKILYDNYRIKESFKFIYNQRQDYSYKLNRQLFNVRFKTKIWQITKKSKNNDFMYSKG